MDMDFPLLCPNSCCCLSKTFISHWWVLDVSFWRVCTQGNYAKMPKLEEEDYTLEFGYYSLPLFLIIYTAPTCMYTYFILSPLKSCPTTKPAWSPDSHHLSHSQRQTMFPWCPSMAAWLHSFSVLDLRTAKASSPGPTDNRQLWDQHENLLQKLPFKRGEWEIGLTARWWCSLSAKRLLEDPVLLLPRSNFSQQRRMV